MPDAGNSRNNNGRQLEHKIVYIPTGETVVVCTGVVLLDGHSNANRAYNCSWKFLEPECGYQKHHKVVKNDNNAKSLKALKEHIESLGYEMPEAFGLILPTNFKNITVKKRRVFVRVNTTTGATSFSFQYQPESVTSYHDAVENAVDLRDHLTDSRMERQKLLERIAETDRVLRLIKAHKPEL